MFTSLKTITRLQVRDLLLEARTANDPATVRDCRTFLQGRECGVAAMRLVRVINDCQNAQAQTPALWGACER